jgi:O-antigen/teichoic acid export membrane protein
MITRFFPNSKFGLNVLTLMTGTAIAQAIPLAISPILTRIYTPDDFGLFAFYLVLVSIVGVMATGRYEMAIMMPAKEEEDEVRTIVSVATSIMLMVAFISFAVVLVFNKQITNTLGRPEISNLLYFLPLSIVLTGLYQILNYLLIRKRKFKQLSINKICASSILGPSQMGMGLLGMGAMGMLVSNILSFVVTSWMVLRSSDIRDVFKVAEWKQAKKVAAKYSQYPKYDIPSILVNLIANQLPLLVMGKYFGLGVLGFYSLMSKTFMAPIGLISNSILDVFKQRATEDFQKFGNCRDIYVKILIKLLLVGFIPFLVIAVYGADIFAFVFGEQWRSAGVMAQILSPAFFLNFLVNPLSYTFYIVQKQNLNLAFSLSFLVLMTLAVVMGIREKDTFRFVVYLSIAQCINYAIYLYVSYRFSRGAK